MAHLREMSVDDPILQIIEAMGFLALITRETPGKITIEREASARALKPSIPASTPPASFTIPSSNS